VDKKADLLRRTGIWGAGPSVKGLACILVWGSLGGVSARGWLLKASAALLFAAFVSLACCLARISAIVLS